MRVTSVVKGALSNNHQARNSDKVLLLQVWHDMGLDLTPVQTAKFLGLPTPETIRRVRQKLQEDGKYLANEEVQEARYNMFKDVRSEASFVSPEQLETLIQGELV